MYDRNVKSQRILTELCAIDSENVCKGIAKFHSKILLDSRVINLQIGLPMTKYLGRIQWRHYRGEADFVWSCIGWGPLLGWQHEILCRVTPDWRRRPDEVASDRRVRTLLYLLYLHPNPGEPTPLVTKRVLVVSWAYSMRNTNYNLIQLITA